MTNEIMRYRAFRIRYLLATKRSGPTIIIWDYWYGEFIKIPFNDDLKVSDINHNWNILATVVAHLADIGIPTTGAISRNPSRGYTVLLTENFKTRLRKMP
jgi:hypothetical protein